MLEQRLRAQLAGMRLAVQKIVSRSRWSKTPGRSRGAAVKQLLSPGTHFEVGLSAASLKWKGIADLIEITSERHVTIADYKTGEPKDDDEQQLLNYALLWARDAVRNPDYHPADRLVICYADKDREIKAPDATALTNLEKEVKRRTAAIRSLLLVDPPPATVGPHTCPFCDVRQLCEDYWRTRDSHPADKRAATFGDFELEVQHELSGSTYETKCLFASVVPFPRAVLLHVKSTYTKLEQLIQPGIRLRVLQVPVPPFDEDERPVICLASVGNGESVLPLR